MLSGTERETIPQIYRDKQLEVNLNLFVCPFVKHQTGRSNEAQEISYGLGGEGKSCFTPFNTFSFSLGQVSGENTRATNADV